MKAGGAPRGGRRPSDAFPASSSTRFSTIQAGRPNSSRLREERLPLPGAELGYSKVLFVGTTGAGKTSLLRHLIGSDPKLDRFPSTSTARTTIADIEVIAAEGAFEAVVTFESEFLVQASVEECIADACAAVWDKASDAKVADRLLNHRDQRFRLGYVLGGWTADTGAEDDDWAFQGDTAELELLPEEEDAPSPRSEHKIAPLLNPISDVSAG